MKVEIRNRCSDFESYRAARVKSLFNCASGADFALDAELPIEDAGWRIGVIVGGSGTGKTPSSTPCGPTCGPSSRAGRPMPR